MAREYDGVPEYYVEGLDFIELLGSTSRYVMFDTRTDGGILIRKPKVLIVMQNAALPDALGKCMKVPCNEIVQSVRRLIPEWMH